uniref:Rab-GAP TBC domain-containing protein n=1 Tax=Timspurckia oligopyrenoides TaxID=708627 RepID=A0A7S1EQV6_9RHOD|mmetsp:Transcript_13063/g.23502  ORF Transcript_13063/g.23502 Transcript_13063/m.23502 type:complete len:466 (+) Transcript_13063:74-1471(+)
MQEREGVQEKCGQDSFSGKLKTGEDRDESFNEPCSSEICDESVSKKHSKKLRYPWKSTSKSSKQSSSLNRRSSTQDAVRSETNESGNVSRKESNDSFPRLTLGEEKDVSMLWQSDILPQWEKKRRSKKTRALVYAGLPSHIRGRIWFVCCGNQLNLTPDLFEVLVEQAHRIRKAQKHRKQQLDAADGDVGGHGGHVEALHNLSVDGSGSVRHSQQLLTHCFAIELDLPRTFPELAFFHCEDSTYYTSLRNILEAFVCFRPTVGYSQGMSFLAAMLLLYLEPFPAFVLFVHMMSPASILAQFFSMEMPRLNSYFQLFQYLLRSELPVLASHLSSEGIEPEMYFLNWVMTMFSRVLSLDATSRVWDMYFYEGDVVIYRTGIGILKLLQSSLLSKHFDEIASMLTRSLQSFIEVEPLIESIKSVNLSASRFRDKLAEHLPKNQLSASKRRSGHTRSESLGTSLPASFK